MDVIETLFEAYNAHDPDAVAACYRPDGEHEDVATGHPRRGAAAVRDGLAYFLTSFPDATWTLAGCLSDEWYCVAWYSLEATLCGDFGPFPPRGQRLALRGVQVFSHEDGLIVRSSDYWDMTTFQRQMTVTAVQLTDLPRPPSTCRTWPVT